MFQYAINIETDEPVMLLNRQIGATYNEDGSWDGEDYIDGRLFQEELLKIDGLSKKRIQIWINSIGGSVVQAMSIYSAILKTATPVDTYNVGLCASSAGIIFMAGRRRFMADYAQLMMHKVSGDDNDKMFDSFMDACSKMIAPKSKVSVEDIKKYMDSETWLNAEQCLELGLCTTIERTADANKKYSGGQDAKNLLSFSNTLINQKTTVTVMKQVTNKLGLNDGSNETEIVNAIEAIKSAKNMAENKIADLEKERDEANAKAKDAQAKIDEMQTDLDEANATIEAQNDEAATVAATEVVNSYANRLGKLEGAVLTTWVNKLKTDPEGTKSLLDALPINAAAPNVNAGKVNKAQNSVAALMATINAKTQRK